MKAEFDKLPAVVETTGFRKTSDDYTFTLATPKRFEEYVKAMLGRLSHFGIFYFRPCAPDEAERFLNNGGPDASHLPDSSALRAPHSAFATVDALAAMLGMTERNVQLLSEKGLLSRPARGQYDLLESCVLLWRGYKELESGRNRDRNQRQTERIEKQNRELDREHLTKMRLLVNATEVQRQIELQNAEIRQKFVYLKALAPGLDGRPVNEIEKRLDEYAKKCLRELDRSGGDVEEVRSVEGGVRSEKRKGRKKAGKKKR